MLRVATFNVNGIRAASRRGFNAWLQGRGCDVVALQEVRCPTALLPDDVFDGYEVQYLPGTLAGRNGVALLTTVPPTAVRSGIGLPEFDHEGRYLEIDVDLDDIPPLTVASVYLPKGAPIEADQAKYDRKMRFMDGLAKYLTKARRTARRNNREFLIMGDFNIAHTPADIRNWRANQKNEGFLPEERAWFGSLLGPRTLTDVVRSVHPEQDGPYSWWSWRGQAFSKDVGWRIDYQLATGPLARAAVSAGTDRDADWESRLSDHAPVVVDYVF